MEKRRQPRAGNTLGKKRRNGNQNHRAKAVRASSSDKTTRQRPPLAFAVNSGRRAAGGVFESEVPWTRRRPRPGKGHGFGATVGTWQRGPFQVGPVVMEAPERPGIGCGSSLVRAPGPILCGEGGSQSTSGTKSRNRRYRLAWCTEHWKIQASTSRNPVHLVAWVH